VYKERDDYSRCRKAQEINDEELCIERKRWIYMKEMARKEINKS